MAALNEVDPQSPQFKELVDYLIAHHVAVTSTLTVFETFTPGRPEPPGVDVLIPSSRSSSRQRYQATQKNTSSIYAPLFKKDMAMELRFARAGGLLIAGTDPTGYGGVIPGYSDQRQVELLVEAGFTPLEAIKICTLNGATYLGREGLRGLIGAGQAGGPGGPRREPRVGHLRHPERVDGLPPGRRLRPREAHRQRDGKGGAFLGVRARRSCHHSGEPITTRAADRRRIAERPIRTSTPAWDPPGTPACAGR